MESERPRDLQDFDVDFRLWHLKKRSSDRAGNPVWSPARWQNVVMAGVGATCLFGFYVLPGIYWREIVADNSGWGLVAGGVLLAVLFFPLMALFLAGLTRWPRLIVDRRNRELICRRRLSRRADAVVPFDQIRAWHTKTLTDTHDGDTGVFEVLYAELDDGRIAGIAVQPSQQLVAELRTMTRAARR